MLEKINHNLKYKSKYLDYYNKLSIIKLITVFIELAKFSSD
jgi:hypothetical protein